MYSIFQVFIQNKYKKNGGFYFAEKKLEEMEKALYLKELKMVKLYGLHNTFYINYLMEKTNIEPFMVKQEKKSKIS